MAVTLYASTDASAPTLTGQADSLNNVLKACLVDGYGSKAAAGWTSPYYDSSSKTRVFLTAGSPSAYLQVQDNGPTAGGMREARIFGYETMSAYNVGTGLFPTAVQRANGFCVRKSASADATARAWWLLADDKRFYFFPITGDVANSCSMAFFGQFKSYKPDDDYRFMIMARIVENVATYTTAQEQGNYRQAGVASVGNLYAPRSYTGVGGSAAIGQITDSAKAVISTGTPAGSTGLTYPNPADGGLYLARTWLNEVNVMRGEQPGIWQPMHNRPLNHGDTFSGVEGLAGRNFLCLWMAPGGCLFLETSDTWDT